MSIFRRSSAILAIAVAFALSPLCAADNRDRSKDEYAVIRDGLAPNGKLSLAAHGEGDDNDDFRIWLMSEPAHRTIAALDDLGPDNTLDTGPEAYSAFWSDDSRHVAIAFPSDRHVLQLNIYGIENGRARLLAGPNLYKRATGRKLVAQDDLSQSAAEIVWKGRDRFVLRERRLFLTSDTAFVSRLGAYGKINEKLDDGRLAVEFSAEAEAMLAPGNRYRITRLRVGKFGA
jgi:hypothetical protein